jgi:hypothetical protein
VAIDLNTPRYTKAQLVEAAKAQGYSATDRLLTDWQAAGLLDQPTKRGLGRGKGIEALWPESQLRLWLLLLQKRSEITQVPTLCNIPVGLWLYFGDQYASLRQVRKCMRTWAYRYGSSRGYKQAKQSARALLADVPMQASKNARADLISAMARALFQGISTAEERRHLRDRLIGSVMNAGVEQSAAAATVEIVLIRLLGARYLAKDDVADHILAWARVYHLFGLRSYIAAHESGSLPNVPGVDFSAPDFEKLITNACRDLVSAVGMAMSLGQGEQLPAPLFHPDMWKKDWANVDVQWHVEPVPILLPDGRQRARFQFTVSGNIKP